jgi:hypothetical protein
MNPTTRGRFSAAALAVVASACSSPAAPPASFAGTWVGTSPFYDLQLTLLQRADTVNGTAGYTLHPSGYQCLTDHVAAMVRGDSIVTVPSILGSIGCNNGVTFRGRRPPGTTELDAEVTIDSTTTMVLTLQ